VRNLFSFLRRASVAAVAVAALAVSTRGVAPRFLADDPISEDPELQDASNAVPVDLSETYDFVQNTFLKDADKTEKRAVNVNTIDEVPDSSWFTHRLGTAEVMSIDDIVRGPFRGQPPQPGKWTVVGGKSEGISPGLTMKDSAGTLYFVKFDPKSNPEMASGAEVISTRFFYALGFNVPENYIVSVRREDLELSPDARIRDEQGRRRAMTTADVDRVLARVARRPDGAYRILASKGLGGKDLGPFRYYGTRPDDPNDIYPHEHRRELRALRVSAAWLNHDDSRSINTRDFLQEAGGGRQLLRHYLIDFGSTLGSGSTQAQGIRAGNEYIWEARPTFITMLTLGFYVRPWIKVNYPDLPAIGRFEAKYFRPERWKPEYPNPAFENARPDDLYWGARHVVAMTDEAILAVVRTAEYTDPEATAYLTQALITRRDKVGQLWLNAVLPIEDFTLSSSGKFTFSNIAVDAKVATRGAGYTIEWSKFDNVTDTASTIGEAQTTTELSADAPAGALESEFVQVKVTGKHPDHPGWSLPCRVVFRKLADGWKLVGVERM
jgi:hypothetical protein